MSDLSTRADVCAKYGLADRELVDFLDSPGGFIFETADGIRLIDVPDDTPDGDDKTGLMYLQPPVLELGYQGGFPVYVPLPEDLEAAAVNPAEAPAKPKRSRKAKTESPATATTPGAPDDTAGDDGAVPDPDASDGTP